MKRVTLNRLWQEYSFMVRKPKREVRALPCSVSAGNVPIEHVKVFTILCVRPQMTAKVLCVLTLRLQMHFDYGGDWQIQNLQIMRVSCMLFSKCFISILGDSFSDSVMKGTVSYTPRKALGTSAGLFCQFKFTHQAALDWVQPGTTALKSGHEFYI